MVMPLRGPHERRVPEIIAAYREGAPIRELREQFGLSDATVYRILKRHGVPVQQRTTRVVVSEDKAADVARLYAVDRLSLELVGERVGLSRRVVERVLREQRIPLRERGNPPLARCQSCGQRIPNRLAQSL